MPKKAIMAVLLIAFMAIAAICGGCGNNNNDNDSDSGNDSIATINDSPDTEIININGQPVTSGMLDELMLIAICSTGKSLDNYNEAELEELRNTTLESIISNTVVMQYLDEFGTGSLTSEILTSMDNAEMRIRADYLISALVRDGSVSESTLELHIEFTRHSIWFYSFTRDELAISEEALREYYDRNRETMKLTFAAVSHIVVATTQEAEEIYQKLDAGEDFAELAKAFSLDTGTKPDGGAMPYFARGETIPEFEDVVFSMKIGEISDPVRTIYGYHIIKLDDLMDQELELDEIKGHIQDVLVKEACNEKIRQLRQEASIEYLEI